MLDLNTGSMYRRGCHGIEVCVACAAFVLWKSSLCFCKVQVGVLWYSSLRQKNQVCVFENSSLHQNNYHVSNIIIHQIFSLARDWSKRVTWANITQLKLGNIRGYSPIFKTDAHSFPRASLSENCSLLGTDNVHGQISEHIFAPNEGYCLFIT